MLEAIFQSLQKITGRYGFQLYTCDESSNWSNLILVSDLLFSLPFTTSCVEQIFSQLKAIKTSLHTSTVNYLLEITVEGPSLPSFNADLGVDFWWRDCCTTRRTTSSTQGGSVDNKLNHVT